MGPATPSILFVSYSGELRRVPRNHDTAIGMGPVDSESNEDTLWRFERGEPMVGHNSVRPAALNHHWGGSKLEMAPIKRVGLLTDEIVDQHYYDASHFCDVESENPSDYSARSLFRAQRGFGAYRRQYRHPFNGRGRSPQKSSGCKSLVSFDFNRGPTAAGMPLFQSLCKLSLVTAPTPQSNGQVSSF